MGIPKNYYEIELDNGNVVQLTLNFAALYKLRNANKPLYDRYMKSFNSDKFDELDSVQMIYTAYVCANLSKGKYMTFEEFLEVCPSDRELIGNCVSALLTSKKKQASPKHSEQKPRK